MQFSGHTNIQATMFPKIFFNPEYYDSVGVGVHQNLHIIIIILTITGDESILGTCLDNQHQLVYIYYTINDVFI